MKMKAIVNVLKYILLSVWLCFYSLTAMAQLEGYWKGKLNLGVQQLELDFNIHLKEGAYAATMDVPAQGAFKVPVNEVAIDGDSVSLGMTALKAMYKGRLHADTLEGTFTQRGMAFPLVLTRSEKEVKQARPQDPKEPYGYRVEEVRFANERDQVELAGTLTVPNGEGPFPAVVLVSGSGAQDRNEEVFNHRPFWVIADHFSQNGIAVLRYDDRGVGGSGGDPASATTLDLSYDAEAAFDFLSHRAEVDASKIGILGHSEGGLINFMIAARRPEVAFLISMAGPAVRGTEVLKAQQQAMYEVSGMPDTLMAANMKFNESLYAVIDSCEHPEVAVPLLKQKFLDAGMAEKEADRQVETLSSPWMWYFLKYDPKEAIAKTSCPTLLLNGSKDLQVLVNQNFSAYEKSMAKYGKTNLSLKEMPGLNHLFQHCQTGSPTEYYTIDETVAPEVLHAMVDFVHLLK